MDNFFKSSYIIKLVLKWKWQLLIILFSTIVLSIIFSGPYFIKPKYKSYAVIYPANIAPYSAENNTEQMLQLLKSEDILVSIINKFHLNREYKVDTNDKYFRSKMINILSSNMSIKKTEYESVLIEVLDQDAVQACDMLKEFLNLMNDKARQLQRQKTSEIVKINHDQMIDKQHAIDSIEDRLEILRKEYNILDYNIQVKEYSKGYVKSVTSGHGNNTNDIAVTLQNLKTFGGEYKLLEAYLYGLLQSYNIIRTEYDKSVSDLSKNLTYANIVTNPVVADKKCYPIRWLIVLVTSVSTLLFSLMLFSFIGNKRKTENIPQ